MPSLSSTVDTLQSTPTQTPIQHGNLPVGKWRRLERSELTEPIRSKRKFPLFKRAKRLPHHPAIGTSGDGSGRLWEVHAAVFDIEATPGYGSLDRFERGNRKRNDTNPPLPQSLKQSATKAPPSVPTNRSAFSPADSRPNRSRGRSVRFQGIEDRIDSRLSRVAQSLNSEEEKDPSLSSSFSLSKFKFPEPPVEPPVSTFCKS